MSDKQFFKQYANKINDLTPSDATTDMDWAQMNGRLNLRDRNRKKKLVIYFMLFALIATMSGWLIYKDYANGLAEKKAKLLMAEPNATSKNNSSQTSDIGQPTTESNPETLPVQMEKSSYTTIESDQNETIHKSNTKTPIYSEKTYNSTKKTKNNPFTSSTIGNDKLWSKSDDHKTTDLLAQKEFISSIDLEYNNVSLGNIAIEPLESEINRIAVKIDTIELLPSLSSNKPVLSNNSNLFALGLTSKVILTYPKSSLHYFVKVDGGLVHAFPYSMAEVKYETLVFPHNIDTNMGFQNGLTFQIQKDNKWKFGLGIARTQLMQHSSHIATLKLTDGICLNPNSSDPKEYAFTYNVSNGQSSSTISLRLSEENSGISIDSTESFMINMGMKKQTTIWSIPLTVERKIIDKNKWKVFAKGGFSFAYATSSFEHITHYSEACADLCFNHGFSPSLISQKSNTIYSGLILGSSVEWGVLPRLSFILNPEVNTNILTSRNQVKRTNLTLNFGLQYRINH